MANAVFLATDLSRSSFSADSQLRVQARFLADATLALGDNVVIYSTRRPGVGAYVARARLKGISQRSATHFTANFEDVAFFDPELALQVARVYVEASLISGSITPEPWVMAQAVRIITSSQYDLILETDRLRGLPLGLDEPAPRYNSIELRAVTQVCRPARSAAFTRNVRAAYEYKCALSHETKLSADGASSGLQSCHIVSVEFNGSDEISNGILFRPDLHWHYDNGNLVIDEHFMCELIGDCAKLFGLPSASRIPLRLPKLQEQNPTLEYLKAHGDRFA